MSRFSTALAAIALAALAPRLVAAAEAPSPPAAASPSKDGAPAAAEARKDAPRGDAAPRVRASHKVDVIAPGERVETVLERFRAGRTPAAPDGQQRARPEGHGGGERGAGSHQAPGGMPGGHHGAEHGAAPPAGTPGMAPPPGTAPPGVAPGTAPPGSMPGHGEHSPGRQHR